ncbi:DUF2249 domain-containing protein [Halorubellus sp. PRR65]|uniref:DUF2249 domain-containing protein n=1 Tax=Halorubellus sp. PRR65 TaxID=3098148 RepID=UPI002B26390A|nr:DUF2249 domain-containing protein [Halorubellus sp. PRR65]
MASHPSGEYGNVVDAREIDGEPFTQITAALDALDAGETMLLVNSFEPAPLYGVLSDRGLSFDASRVDEDEWHVEITRE